MRQNLLLLIPVLLPIVADVLVFTVKRIRGERKLILGIPLTALPTILVICTAIAFQPDDGSDLWQLTDTITTASHMDNMSRSFSLLTCFVWLMVGMFSVGYMKCERDELRLSGFYLIVLGVLIGPDCAANLVTSYVFYEMMTLTSLPLASHELTKETMMVGLEYLYYSVAGALLALFGIFVIVHYAATLTFIPGGVLDGATLAGHEGLLLVVVSCMIVGFDTKVDMFPMHGWLPTVHSVAPASVSAVLLGFTTKTSILGIVRVTFFMVSPDLIRGTRMQTAWMVLALLTAFMGSILVYKEPVMKKRLAYSTVSQVPYMMFGLSLLTFLGMVGALSHVVSHSLVKNMLSFGVGAIIYKIGLKRISELRGIGKQMPTTIRCLTLVFLILVGVSPTSGFVSKRYLATGALAVDVGTFPWIGPVVLLISVLLTAGYLLSVTIHGFSPGADYDYGNMKELEPSLWMLVPMLLMTAEAVVFGVFPTPLIHFIETIASAVM